MTVHLYNNTSDVRRISKSLSDMITIDNAVLKDSVTVTNPTINISGYNDIIHKYNYLYIPQFERYYFINSTTIISNDLCMLECSVDVLQTYSEDILNSICVVARNSDGYNLDLQDSDIPIEMNSMVRTILFRRPIEDIETEGELVFDSTNVKYILLTAGGVD